MTQPTVAAPGRTRRSFDFGVTTTNKSVPNQQQTTTLCRRALRPRQRPWPHRQHPNDNMAAMADDRESETQRELIDWRAINQHQYETGIQATLGEDGEPLTISAEIPVRAAIAEDPDSETPDSGPDPFVNTPSDNMAAMADDRESETQRELIDWRAINQHQYETGIQATLGEDGEPLTISAEL